MAYAKKYGAVGWGVVERPGSYRLIPRGHRDDRLGGIHRHRLDVTWKAAAPRLRDGLRPDEIHASFGIYHPVGTSASIAPGKAERLIRELDDRFKVG